MIIPFEQDYQVISMKFALLYSLDKKSQGYVNPRNSHFSTITLESIMKYKKLQVIQFDDIATGKDCPFSSHTFSSSAIDQKEMGELILETRRQQEKIKLSS